MSSPNIKYGRADKLDLINFFVGVQRKILDDDYTLTAEDPVTTFFDPNGADRIVTLPAAARGLYFVIFNSGSANQLTVNDDNGVPVIALSHVEGAQFFCSGVEWRYLAGVSAAVLAADLASADGTVTITQPTPTVVDLAVNEAAVDHNLLLNYVADQHVAHSGVVLTAGSGISGGGDITASRTFSLDLNDLTADTPTLSDEFAFNDITGGDTNKATLAVLNSILDHDALLGFVGNEHIDHTTVSISAGTGLTGGGTIAASRTLSLDINGLTADTPVSGDFLVFYDASGGDTNKVTIANLFAAVVAPGSDTQVLFNDSGAFGADGGMVYNKTTDALTLAGTLTSAGILLAAGNSINWGAGALTLTEGGGNLLLTTATAASGLTIRNTDTGANGSALVLDSASTSPAVSDLIAQFVARGRDSGGNANDYAYIRSHIASAVNGTESGTLQLLWQQSGASYRTLELGSNNIYPATSDTIALGATANRFSDLFLALGAVIDFNADITLTHAADLLTLAGGTLVLPSAGLQMGSSVPFSDAAGVLTLQNVDALDATTEATVEAAIDTLANLTSVQGRTVTLADAGADAIFGWDDSANAYQNLAAADVRAAAGVSYGKQSIWIPAHAMTPQTTNGAASNTLEMTTNDNMLKTLDFDSATQEYAQVSIRMPKSWNESTLTFIPVWSHPATTTNFGVAWALSAVAISNDDALDAAFGTSAGSTDTGGTTNDLYHGPESGALTVGGTPAAEDYVNFRIHRSVGDGGDTLAVDARLHGILLLYTNDATNDT